jgi:hypothetical protein
VLRELDTALESASPGFKEANRQHARMSRTIDAVGEGRDAAQRGRTEDIVRDFAGRPADQQAAFRVGYADRLIEQAQNQAPGALTSLAACDCLVELDGETAVGALVPVYL